jgi:hypothetical protein
VEEDGDRGPELTLSLKMEAADSSKTLVIFIICAMRISVLTFKPHSTDPPKAHNANSVGMSLGHLPTEPPVPERNRPTRGAGILIARASLHSPDQ